MIQNMSNPRSASTDTILPAEGPFSGTILKLSSVVVKLIIKSINTNLKDTKYIVPMGLFSTYMINFATYILCLRHVLKPRRGEILVENELVKVPKSRRDDI